MLGGISDQILWVCSQAHFVVQSRKNKTISHLSYHPLWRANVCALFQPLRDFKYQERQGWLAPKTLPPTPYELFDSGLWILLSPAGDTYVLKP